MQQNALRFLPTPFLDFHLCPIKKHLTFFAFSYIIIVASYTLSERRIQFRMKKLFIIPTAVLTAALLLSSCGKNTDQHPSAEGEGTPTSHFMDSIYNSDAPYIYEKISAIESLDFSGDTVKSNKHFLVTRDADSIIHIYSTITGKEILKYNEFAPITASTGERAPTVSETSTTDYNIFSFPAKDLHILAVSKVKTMTVSYENINSTRPAETHHTMEVTFYDGAGNIFYSASDATLKAIIGTPDKIPQYMKSTIVYGDTNLFSIDNAVFSYDKTTGSVAKVRDFDTTAIPRILFMSDEYYYSIDSTSHTLQVFDGSLNKVSTAILPEHTELHLAKYGPLPNGNVIFQYRKELPSTDEEYDIISVEEINGKAVSHKYDLITLVVTAATGDVESIDAGFVINSIVDFDLLDKLSGTNEYKKAFNSVSVIADIDYITEEKELSGGHMYSDIVVLSDDGTVAHSLKRKSRWIDIPKIIGDGIFAVKTLNDEIEIIDRDGNTIFVYGTTLAGKSDTLIKTDGAIYNVTTGEKIFDASENDAIIKSTSCGIFTIQIKNELTAVHADGSTKLLGIFNQADKTLDDFYASNLGYYYIVYSVTGQHEYFNEYGEKLGIFDNKIECIGETFGGYLFHDTVSGKYYRMTTAKVSNK